jgi:hypothetical protein
VYIECLEWVYDVDVLLSNSKARHPKQHSHLRYHILVTFVLLILFCN